MAKLTFVLEDGQEVVVPLTERITIGRAEDNDVLVDDERISLQHAELLQNADGSIQVFDLNSESGTFVNGERQESCTLLHGDRLAFGPLTGRLDLEDLEAPAGTPEETSRDDEAHAEQMARMEAEKARLQAAVDAGIKDLRDWEKRAEKERALHLARVESLRAEEAQLAPLQTAVRDTEAVHQKWLDAISTLSAQHQEKTAAFEGLSACCAEKSTELERLTAEAATTTREVEALTARLKQVRDECEQDEALLNSLRQQIIKLEVNVKEEEIRQAAQAASGAELVKKRQKDEAAVKDLESLLMKLEQQGAATQGDLQRRQEEMAGWEKKLAGAESALLDKKDELAACEKNLASFEKKLAGQKDALEAENRRIEQATARRAEIQRQCEELADVTRQLANARQQLVVVEKRLEAAKTEPPPQLAVPKRKSSKESTVKSDDLEAKHQELMRQIESARLELGELQGKITAQRDTPVSLPKALAERENTVAQLAAAVSVPVIVQVEPVKLSPVSMKSERAKASAGVSRLKSAKT